MITCLYYLAQIILGYLLADFIMGVYHWFKDTYFTPFTPIIGEFMIWNSRLHHIRPRYVIEFSDWQLFWSSGKWTMAWMAPLFYLIGPAPFMISLFMTIALNDVVHKYAHMLDNERPQWASFLQRIYIFQSHAEHHLHHVSPHEINYCPVTPYLNVLLEWINFWRILEGWMERFIGVKPRFRPDEFVEDDEYPAGIKFL